MLRKLISIRNVGRFLSYSAAGDVELKRYNLALAENGRGKTTLCAILRSLQTGDPALVKGRATLGGVAPPEIRLLLADGSIPAFANGAWSTTVPNFAILDSTFVSENVYSGEVVGLEHKRKLYGVIVGKTGADMARRIDELDDASRRKSAEVREWRGAVQALAQGLTPDAFLALPADPAVDEKIAGKERELEAVRQADQIRSRAGLAVLRLPELPGGLAAVLNRTLEGVAVDAEQRVVAQIEAHAMHERGRAWLSEGLGYVHGEACPFCGQGLGGVELIAAYRAYFSEAYNALRREIAALRERIESALGDRAIAGFERIPDQNAAAVEFWSRYCTFDVPAITGMTGDAIRALREAALALLDRKAVSPLEPVAPGEAFTAALTDVAAVRAEAAAYNEAVAAANAAIAAKKDATDAADIRTVEAEVTRLRATKARHEAAGAAACRDLATALAEKEAIERDKESVKEKLDEYAKNVMVRMGGRR
jgi:wobble nucleotide-excising tRNase